MKSINLPPYAPILMESTRAIGYSLEAAIADIIDNSISAKASNIWVSFFPIDEAYIAILDDGIGMDSITINTAMQYGSKNPSDSRDSNDLGRFGLGLKTASLSQCKVLTVARKSGNKIEARQWDLDYVASTGEWSLGILNDMEIENLPEIQKLKDIDSGTLVIWKNLDRLTMRETNLEQYMGKKMDDVCTHLSLVYHRYLFGEIGLKKIKIFFNEMEVKAIDPFIVKRNTQVMDDEIITVRGSKVTIRPYVLPHLSKLTNEEINSLGGKEGLQKRQGFYIYRNKRLLVWGTWFRMMRQGGLSKLARIQVDIPNVLDDLWTLDIRKSTAIPPPDLRKNLSSVIDKIAETSKRTWTVRGKKEMDDSYQHIWNRYKNREGGVYYEINRDHPLVDQITTIHPDIKSNLDTLLKQIECGIPLNKLYLDFNNDEHIDNEDKITEIEVEDMINQLTSLLTEKNLKLDFLLSMENVEPFNNYPDIIEKLKGEVY